MTSMPKGLLSRTRLISHWLNSSFLRSLLDVDRHGMFVIWEDHVPASNGSLVARGSWCPQQMASKPASCSPGRSCRSDLRSVLLAFSGDWGPQEAVTWCMTNP